MRFTPFFILTLSFTSLSCVAQTAAPQMAAPAAAPAVAATTAPLPSDLMKRSVDELEQVGSSLKLEKWKGGSIRNEASANLASIQKDVQGTLPSLLKDADAAPQSVSALLPVSRNVDALYDVLLRVVDGARIAGTGEQVTQLQQVLTDLEKGRHALDDRLVELAAGQEKRVSDLQVAIKTQPAPVCPVVAPPPAPAPVAKKKVVKKKPAAPATAPGSSTPAAAPKPN